MARVKVGLSKKSIAILLVVCFLILGGTGGYLLWRVNQPKTVAPTESEASIPAICTRCKPGFCVNDHCKISGNKNTFLGRPYCSESDCVTDHGHDMCVGCNYTDGQGNSRYCTMNDTEQYECGVESYEITFNTSTGGSVNPEGKKTVAPNGSISCTATPNVGYMFDKWEGSGGGTVGYEGGDISKLVISSVTSDGAYTAKFAKSYTLEIQVSPEGAGEVYDKDGRKITGAKYLQIKENSIIWNRAEANTGYHFVKWSDGKTDNPREERITSNLVLTAIFEKKTAETVKLTYSASKGGSIRGEKVQTIPKGGDGKSVEAIASSGYQFTGWNDGVKTASRTDKKVQNDITAIAQFKSSGKCKFIYEAKGEGLICVDNNQDRCRDLVEFEIENGQYTPVISALPNKGYKFLSWSDKKPLDRGRDKCVNNYGSVPVVRKYIAKFQERTPIVEGLCIFTYKVDPQEGGEIEGKAQQTVKEHEIGTTVVAKPKPGYTFSGWQDKIKAPDRADLCEIFRAAVQDPPLPNTPLEVIFTALFTKVETPPSCGDGICSGEETAENCPEDCPSVCGDGICSPDEDAQSCPEDCPSVCGDGICGDGEDSENCPEDCGAPVTGGVPETGLFDETENVVIMGIVLLILGMGWTWISTLPKKTYTTISKISSSISQSMTIAKKRSIVKEREKRRNKLEKRIK
ncbi:MAG: InlB B-repeat-containing protein [Candidatus Dojkabacteria bacterium]|jgi:hypothetical protein